MSPEKETGVPNEVTANPVAVAFVSSALVIGALLLVLWMFSL